MFTREKRPVLSVLPQTMKTGHELKCSAGGKSQCLETCCSPCKSCKQSLRDLILTMMVMIRMQQNLEEKKDCNIQFNVQY